MLPTSSSFFLGESFLAFALPFIPHPAMTRAALHFESFSTFPARQCLIDHDGSSSKLWRWVCKVLAELQAPCSSVVSNLSACLIPPVARHSFQQRAGRKAAAATAIPGHARAGSRVLRIEIQTVLSDVRAGSEKAR